MYDTAVYQPWPDVKSLFEPGANPYPVDCLPEYIRDAVIEVQSYVQAPMSLVSSSAISAVSTIVQPLIDVVRNDRLSGPTSLYYMTVAESGERKTTCDNFFTAAIIKWQRSMLAKKKDEISKFEAEFDAWNAKRKGILENIRINTIAGKTSDLLESELTLLHDKKPIAPRIPYMLLGDETPEHLAWTLVHEWPSCAVISSEAGSVLGTHGMSRDSIMRSLALLNILWDGGEFRIGRKTSESFTVRDCRLTLGIMTQKSVIKNFIDRSDGIARGSGFLSRFLFSFPESTQGTRLSKPEPSWDKMRIFDYQIRNILENYEINFDDDGYMRPTKMTMTDDAKIVWENFYNHTEKNLSLSGSYIDIRDIAAKSAENAARLAAVLGFFGDNSCRKLIMIDDVMMKSACEIIQWHLTEAINFFSHIEKPEQKIYAKLLIDWIIEKYSTGSGDMTPREICQRCPKIIRKFTPGKMLDEFEKFGIIRKMDVDGKTVVKLNPTLLN